MFSLKQKKLQILLRIISGGIEKNSKKKEILSNILVKIINKKIFFISTNNEIEIVTYTEIDVDKNLEIIIPFKRIYDICNLSDKNEYIYFKYKNNNLEIKSGNSIFTIQNYKECTFPLFLKDKNMEKKIKINSSILKMLFIKTMFCLNGNDPRTFLNGTLLEIEHNFIYSVSSDGNRLSINYTKIKTNIKEKIIIPKKLLKEFISIFPNNIDIILYNSKNYVKILTNNITITSRLINDTYPNYKNFMEDKNTNDIIELKKNDFKLALLKTSIINIKKEKNANIDIKNGKMVITLKNNYEKIVTNLYINNKEIRYEFGINIIYIIEVLNIMQSENIEILLNKQDKGIIFKEKNPYNSIHLIMPYEL